MPKYLVFFTCLLILPQATRAQTSYAVVDYAALTDSLYERFGGRALVDSVHTYHMDQGKTMVKRFQSLISKYTYNRTICQSIESLREAEDVLERHQNKIRNYEEQIINTAIPALDSSLTVYLNDLTLQIIRNYSVVRPGLSFYNAQSILYRDPAVTDLTKELLAYIETQRGYRKRFTLYAESKLVSLGLSTR
jgi:hypothetical protein